MKQKSIKLRLHRRTIHHLSLGQAAQVQGGAGSVRHQSCIPEICEPSFATCAYSDCFGGASCASNCGIPCFEP